MAYVTRVTGDKRIRLRDVDPGEDGGLTRRQAEGRLAKLNAELLELQELMYAAERDAVLVILQGMDASGKDVTIRHVMSATNVQASRVRAFKPMTDEEAAHDFLWRAHAHTPALGQFVIFDRSYYEQVVFPQVQDELPMAAVRGRFAHINNFESLLADHGTIVVKFLLHVSSEVQERRLQQREENDDSAWNLSGQDWAARRDWDTYMAAYEETINACATEKAPWCVVPADNDWFHNLAVAETLVARLRPYRDGWVEERNRRGEEHRAEAREARGEA